MRVDLSEVVFPPQVLEAVARKLAAIKMRLSNNGERLPADLWCQTAPEALALCEIMLKAWPGLIHFIEGEPGREQGEFILRHQVATTTEKAQ